MQPKDADDQHFHFDGVQDIEPSVPEDIFNPPMDTFDEGFDFERLTSE